MNVPVSIPKAAATPARKNRMAADDRHRQLLRSAIDCVARNGFGGTKTKDIAAAAGVSEAILFRHFATKEDLYHAILDMKATQDDGKGMKRLMQQLEECAARRDDAGVFGAILHAIFGSFREDPAFHRLLLYAMLEGHLMASLFHKRLGAGFQDFLRRYVALRQSEGAFRGGDPELMLTFAVGTAVHCATGKYIFGLKKSTVADEDAVNQLIGFVLNGLTEPAAARLRNHKKNGKGNHAS